MLSHEIIKRFLKKLTKLALVLSIVHFEKKEIYNNRGPTHPFLLKWRSKYDKRMNPDFNQGKISFL